MEIYNNRRIENIIINNNIIGLIINMEEGQRRRKKLMMKWLWKNKNNVSNNANSEIILI